MMNWVTDNLFGFLIAILLFPLAWIVCTPFILVSACFDPGPYFGSVADRYTEVTDFMGRHTSFTDWVPPIWVKIKLFSPRFG